MDTNKYQKLVNNLAAELGIESNLINFKQDFINTGWRCGHQTNRWESIIKNPARRLPDLKSLPPTRDNCYCNTEIHWNHLIQHKATGKYFTIGNVCIRHLGVDMRKRCIDCNQYNSKHTTRCGACRVKCQIHGEYHDDNRACKFWQIHAIDSDESDEEDIQPSDPMKDQIRFGKHKGRAYQWIKENDLQYLKWVARTIEDKAWLADHI